jgi:hypothetical protein
LSTHEFLLKPGQWLGEGNITFTQSPDKIHFATRWTIDPKDHDEIVCTQQVEMQGSDEMVHNVFCLSDIAKGNFAIELENQLIGKVMGQGVLEPKTIAWEFRSHLNFQGYEVYKLQENGEYHFHAEYASPDQFRTIIDGRIWKKGD